MKRLQKKTILMILLSALFMPLIACNDCSNVNIPAWTIEKGTNEPKGLMAQERVDGSLVRSDYVRQYSGGSPSESRYSIYDATGIDADMVIDFGQMAPSPVLQGEVIGTIEPEEGGKVVKSGTTSEGYGEDITVVLDVYDVDLSFLIDKVNRVLITGQILVFPEDVTIPSHTECVE